MRDKDRGTKKRTKEKDERKKKRKKQVAEKIDGRRTFDSPSFMS